MPEHRADQHLDYLRQCLRQDKAPIGFLLSAGCGVAIQTSGAPLIPDIKGMTEHIRSTFEASGQRETFEKLLATFPDGSANIEELLSRTRALAAVADAGPVHGLDAGSLEELDIAMSKSIAQLVGVDLPETPTPHRSLAAWASSAVRSAPVELFTTNYDLLLEQALERVGVPYFDGFVGSHRPFFDAAAVDRDELPTRWLRLWKLHGSINWRRDDDGRVYRTFVDDGSSPSLIHPSHLKYDESRKMPYLAMIDQLRGFLRKRRATIVICGYSFGDEHLEDVLLQELEGNPTAAAFALMHGALGDYATAVSLAERRPNLSLIAQDAAVIGTQRGDWAPGNDGAPVSITIGDFNRLGDLLAEMSGEPPTELTDAS
jgi:hypothetical protein